MEEYSKYPVEVISGIAEETGMGMVCFLNPDTLETESVPGASYGFLTMRHFINQKCQHKCSNSLQRNNNDHKLYGIKKCL